MVTVEDNTGKKTVTEYPVATLPTLLRAGEYNYILATGQKSSYGDMRKNYRSREGYFLLTSLDKGFESRTLNLATLLHKRYQAAGIGVTQSLGWLGAMSVSTNVSRAEYNDNTAKTGSSVSVRYAKSLTRKTDLQLLTYRYQSEGYIDFASWSPDIRRAFRPEKDYPFFNYQFMTGKEKARYEARLSHLFDGASLALSWWQNSYYGNQPDSQGASLSASTSLSNGVSLYLSGNYTRGNWYGRDEYSTSLGLSIPFTLGGRNYYTSSNASWSRASGNTFSTTAGANLSDTMGYSVNTATTRQGTSAGAFMYYNFDRAATRMSVEQSRDRTSLSGGLSGSALLTGKSGLILSRGTSSTLALVSTGGVEGVRVNGSPPTDRQGLTVMSLSPYRTNTLSLNPDSMPDNTEFLRTSQRVTPTQDAIIWREFGASVVNRYILQIKDREGRLLAGGNGTTENGLNAGFVSAEGVLVMSLLSSPTRITITRAEKGVCSFSAAALVPNINKVQEVLCD